MILSDDEHFFIILNAIHDYHKGENDIAILLVERTTAQLMNFEGTTDTQEIYDEIVEIFNFYNLFIKEKDIDLPIITDEYYELTLMYLNEVQNLFMEDKI